MCIKDGHLGPCLTAVPPAALHRPTVNRSTMVCVVQLYYTVLASTKAPPHLLCLARPHQSLICSAPPLPPGLRSPHRHPLCRRLRRHCPRCRSRPAAPPTLAAAWHPAQRGCCRRAPVRRCCGAVRRPALLQLHQEAPPLRPRLRGSTACCGARTTGLRRCCCALLRRRPAGHTATGRG